MQPNDVSFATRFLRAYPAIRQRILETREFQDHRAAFERRDETGKSKTVNIDGRKFFVVGGDMLRDEDEIMLDWARANGLVSESDVQAYQADEIGRDQNEQKQKGGQTPGAAEHP